MSFYVNKDNSFSFNADKTLAKAVENDKKVQTAAAGMITADIKTKQKLEEIDSQIAKLQKQREDIIEEQKHGRYIKLNLDGRYKKEELTKIFNNILDNY